MLEDCYCSVPLQQLAYDHSTEVYKVVTRKMTHERSGKRINTTPSKINLADAKKKKKTGKISLKPAAPFILFLSNSDTSKNYLSMQSLHTERKISKENQNTSGLFRTAAGESQLHYTDNQHMLYTFNSQHKAPAASQMKEQLNRKWSCRYKTRQNPNSKMRGYSSQIELTSCQNQKPSK